MFVRPESPTGEHFVDDAGKSRDQLLEELKELRSQVKELERRATESTEAHKELLYAAKHDGNTGLLSRVEFMEKLGLEMRSSQRYRYPLSVCLCELDRTTGNGRGNGREELIAAIGRIIREQIRCSDAAARLQSDAFCIIFHHTSASDATSATGRVRQQVEGLQQEGAEAGDGQVTISVGIAHFSSTHETEEDLLTAAQTALQKAQDSGGNCLFVKSV